MSKSEKSLREQLLDARSNLQRQIEILEAGPLIGQGRGPDFEDAKAKLEATLEEIEGSLAQLKTDEADGTDR
jgi:hypothetical protein